MSDEALVVFTFKSVDTLLRHGGTGSWRLNRARARRCKFVVCARNAKDPQCDGPEPHHTGFLVGKVLDVVPASDNDRDFLVQFSEYALINKDEVWRGDRNPVRYAKIEALDIDFAALDWQLMKRGGGAEVTPAPAPSPLPLAQARALTMAEAKKGLALTFGVPAEAIEITIRG